VNRPDIKKRATLVLLFLPKHKWALLILASALLLHFWYIFLNPTTVLYGGPGDHTASLIWLYEQYPQSPWWGHTDMSAAPFGEMLWTPVYLLGQAMYILFWVFSTIFQNGVAGYNALTTLGFIFSFLAMYFTMVKLFNSRRISLAVLSYVATFTPFVMALNSVGHFVYIFAPGYVAILTLFILNSLKSKGSKKYVIATGMISGLSWLIDPYYVLFSTLLIFSMSVGWFIYNRTYSSKQKLLFFIKKVGSIVAVWLICVLPLLFYSHIISSEISSATTVRADITHDAQQYSSRFVDFLLPSVQNPVTPTLLKSYKMETFHGKDATFTLYAGLVFMAALVSGLIWYFITKQKRYRRYIVSFLISSAILLLFSLPPVIDILGLSLPGPSGVIILISDAWRVFARLFIFAFPLLVMVAAALSLLILESKRMWLRIAVVLILVLIPLDMLFRNPIDSTLFWNINSSISANYKIIRDDQSIKTLAEYPLREAPHYKGSLYFTAQLSHEKKILNPMMVNADNHSKARRSLVDLTNPQTVPALKYLGVDAVQVWTPLASGQGVFMGAKGLSLLKNDTTKNIFGESRASLYKIDESVIPQRYIVYVEGTGILWNDKVTDIEENVEGNFVLSVLDLCTLYSSKTCADASVKMRHTVSFSVINNSAEVAELEIESSDGPRRVDLKPGLNSLTATTDGDIKIKSMSKLSIKNYSVQEDNR
jgi:hypothetical protein